MPSGGSEPFVRVDVARAKELIAEGVNIIDVREAREIAQDGKISGSRLVPLNTFLANPTSHIEGDNILFDCKAGVRSAIACEMAAAIGMKTLYNLEGGVDVWRKAGNHVDYA